MSTLKSLIDVINLGIFDVGVWIGFGGGRWGCFFINQ
jgi:hypothetical protein